MALFKDVRDKLHSEVAVGSALCAAGVDARDAVSVADLVTASTDEMNAL